MPGKKTYRFEAQVQRTGNAGGIHYLAVPFSVKDEFGTNSSVRIKGTLNGIAMDRALKPKGDGTHMIILSPELRRQAGLKLGSLAKVIFEKNEEPKKLDYPEEWQAVLDAEPGSKEKFEALNASMQRNVIYWIDTAKRTETRTNRAIEMLNRLMSGRFHIGGREAETS